MENLKIQYGKIEARPEETGYDGSRIAFLNRHFQGLINENKLIGASYCIAKKGKVIAQNALGRYSYRTEDDRPLQPDTIHRIASITKMFTATAVFQLVEAGLLRLDEPMSKYLVQMNQPEFKDITIAQMLSHTSGMYPDPGCYPEETISPWKEIDKMEPGDEDWLRAALKTGLRRKPGEEWQYSSFGFVVLGALIEQVSRQRSDEYIMEHIVKPLRMRDTAFQLTVDMAKRHIIYNEKTEQMIQDTLNGMIIEEKGVWNKIPSTGGGLRSTPFDLVRFGNALLYHGRFEDARILGKRAVAKMTEPYLINTPSYCWGANDSARQYGLGPDLRKGLAITASSRFFFHEGAGGCCLMVEPEEELVAAWYVPLADTTKWYPESMLNVKNVVLSGCM